MANMRKDAPAVSTFADHEVIMPANKLDKAVVIADDDLSADLDAIARAEAALAELSVEFEGWMHAECDRLDSMRAAIRTAGLSGQPRADLFRAAHDIKGQAATFGFPLAAEAADSMCRLIEHTPDPSRVPLELIDQHVDGIRAIIREGARGAGHAIASALATGLRQATDDFLVKENRHRLEYLDGIITFAPPLAPTK